MDNYSTLDNSQIIVGLDIGTTKIATVVGYCDEDGKVCVLGHGKSNSNGVEYGVICNINKTVDAINASTQMAIQRANRSFSEVYSGIAGRHIKSKEYHHVLYRREGKDKIIQQEEIDTMCEDMEHVTVTPGESIISVIPQRFVIDGTRKTTEPVGELGETVEGYYQIITGAEKEIRSIIRCLNTAELSVKNIILEPIASGLACLTEEEKREGVALVDIGGGTTDVAIFVNGNPVFSQVIPIGGYLITKDIASICKIPEELAEKLKVTYGTCIEERSNINNLITIPQFRGREPIQINENYLAQIIHARTVEILNAVQKEIELSGYKDNILGGGLVLTGGGSNLRHLKELCQYTLRLPTRIGIPDVGFAHSTPAELKHPMYATALGLLKYGIQQNSEQNVPIVNTEKKETRKKDKTVKKGPKRHSNSFIEGIKQFFSDVLEKTS